MEYLVQFFSMWTSDPNQAQWLFAGTIGLAVGLFGLGILVVVGGFFDPFRRRLQAVSGAAGGRLFSPVDFGDAFKPLTPYIMPKDEGERTSIRAQLVHAGFRAENAAITFYAMKLILTLAFGGIVVIAAPFFPGFSTMQVIGAAIFASAVAMFLPNIYVSRRTAKRQRSLINGFPDALDLLVTCTEAGLGLNAALQRVGDELTVSHPALAEELALVNAEIRAGVERTDALKGLAHRTGLDDIRGLVSLLCQSMRFGTSIADTLRIYSEEFRDKRMQRAEEQAAKIGTKLIFPLVFCLWPSFFIVAVAPAVLAAMRALAPLH
ncbi:MAG: type II secretion system F family protein [Gammaproteobacteria bacterium]